MLDLPPEVQPFARSPPAPAMASRPVTATDQRRAELDSHLAAAGGNVAAAARAMDISRQHLSLKAHGIDPDRFRLIRVVRRSLGTLANHAAHVHVGLLRDDGLPAELRASGDPLRRICSSTATPSPGAQARLDRPRAD